MPKSPAESSTGRKRAATAPPGKTSRSRTPKTGSSQANIRLSEAERRQYIAEAAYYIAEQRGFQGGSPEADWLLAEAEIERMLASPRH